MSEQLVKEIIIHGINDIATTWECFW